MRSRVVLFLLPVVLVGATAVRAAPAKAPVEKITCTDFVPLQYRFKPEAVSYAIGYDKAKHPDAETIDITGVERIVPMMVKSCKARPRETFLQHVRDAWHANTHRL